MSHMEQATVHHGTVMCRVLAALAIIAAVSIIVYVLLTQPVRATEQADMFTSALQMVVI